MKKNDLNPNIHIQEGNTVLKDNNDYGFLIFSLPVRITCPYATELCKKICYGRNAEELFKHVYNCRMKNLDETYKNTFVRDMIDIINFNLSRKKYANKTIIFRIHETGDFYSQEYFNKWVEISDSFKSEKRIIFQAYTKSLPFLENLELSNINIKIMFSIMPDTKLENINLAKKLNLNTFSAVPQETFIEVEENNKCKGDCAKCKTCYLENKDMYVEFHGNRCPRSKGRIDYEKSIYWSWKTKNE